MCEDRERILAMVLYTRHFEAAETKPPMLTLVEGKQRGISKPNLAPRVIENGQQLDPENAIKNAT